jgi:cell division septation protein DedD
MIGSILALVLYVLVFSFGVENGKRYAIQEIRAERAKQQRMAKELSQPTEAHVPPAKTDPPPGATSAEENLAVPTRSLSGRFTIQLITFTNRKRAEEEVERLKKMGYQGFIIPSGKFFQVCTDAFQDMSEARQKLMRLKAEGFAPSDAYIRPLNGLTPI